MFGQAGDCRGHGPVVQQVAERLGSESAKVASVLEELQSAWVVMRLLQQRLRAVWEKIVSALQRLVSTRISVWVTAESQLAAEQLAGVALARILPEWAE